MEINSQSAYKSLLKRSNTKDDQTYSFNEIGAYNAFMSEINTRNNNTQTIKINRYKNERKCKRK